MAEFAAVASCARNPLIWMQPKDCTFAPRNLPTRISWSCRNHSGENHVVNLDKSLKIQLARFPQTAFNGRRIRKESLVKCCCLQSLIDSEGTVFPNWVLVADQALLTITMVFAYLAGVIPHGRTTPSGRNSTARQPFDAGASADYGSSIECGRSDSWGELRMKLLEALEVNSQNGIGDYREIEVEQQRKNHPLSIFAIGEGPRLRLLLITLHHLEKEVNSIKRTRDFVVWDSWVLLSTGVINGLIQPALVQWLVEELGLETPEAKTKIIMAVGRLTEDNRILKQFNRSGKAELYMELLFFLQSGSLRAGSCYDAKFLTEHEVKILEDLVIFLADGIASIYLELISVDSDVSAEMGSYSQELCSLSTRALQRLRNEVALNWWLHQNFESIAAMYEDRFELYVIRKEQRETTTNNLCDKVIWWRSFGFGKKSDAASFHNFVQIVPFSLAVKRTKELRALTGWRYYFSLFLELSDIAMPFIRGAFTKVSGAISYFLVYMIGRSLGLVFSGIRQSLGWR